MGKMMAPASLQSLCYPAGLTARGACLYVAEHPSEIQGAIRMACSIEAGSISIYVARYYRGNGIGVKTS